MAVTNTAALLAELQKEVDAGGGGGGGALSGLSDVTLTAPALNDVLTYDGADWVNQAPAGGTATINAATVTVPYGLLEYVATVVDAGVSGTSQILIAPGIYADTEENEPFDTDFHVVGVSAGSFAIAISGKGRETIGGAFKFLYMIG